MGEEGVGGELAGDLAGGGSAHSVADDEEAVLRAGVAGIFIALADAAGVGEHGEGGRGFAEWEFRIAAAPEE